MSGWQDRTPDEPGWRFATWNLDWWRRHPQQEPRGDVIRGLRADVVALQEVSGGAARELEREHEGTALFSQAAYEPATWRWMGCALLLKAGVEVIAHGVVGTLPKPQRGLWATVRLQDGPTVTVVSWHAPNAAGDGVATKMAAFRAMSEWLKGRDEDVVLGADVNSWWDSHQLVSMGADDPFADEYAFVGSDPPHGLVDAYRAALRAAGRLEAAVREAGSGALAVSHVLSNGVGHRMDRVYVSPGLGVVAAGYDLGSRRRAGSDHALHWVDFA